MKLICVGRNYADHAKELKNDLPSEPVIFLKPDTALIRGKKVFFIPSFSSDVHHEIEVVLRVCKNGKQIQEKFAHKYFEELTLGIDFTARDLQTKLKSKGLPWELAKAFDSSAPVGSLVPKARFRADFNFRLDVNGTPVQKGNTADMIFSFSKIISFVSSYFTLNQGDLIFTGTPAGVGPVKAGDLLEGFIEDEKVIAVEVR